MCTCYMCVNPSEELSHGCNLFNTVHSYQCLHGIDSQCRGYVDLLPL